MRNWHRLVVASLAVIALGIGIAWAGMNLRQTDDGLAVWQHDPSGNTYAVGRQLLTVRITDISTASTEYVVVPEAGLLTAVQCVLGAAITSADATLRVRNTTQGTATADITVTQSGSAIGDVDTLTGLSVDVAASDVLAVGTVGDSSTTATEQCTLVVDPG